MAIHFQSLRGLETQNSLAPEIGRTNVVLEGDQALCVREHLADAQNELQKWHRDFAVLLARRSRILDQVYRCKVALAPYKKLPVEITREIMLFVVGIPSDFPLSQDMNLDPRLQVTQVCAHWRRIAFATPELWKITLSCIPDHSSASKLISSWWSQCSGSRLSLMMDETTYLQNPGLDREFDGVSFDHFLFDHVIFPYSARLVKLDIIMRVETARKMLALPTGSFKALETFILTVERSLDPSEPLLHSGDLNTAFSSCPALSKVVFRGSSFTNPLLLHIPWQQLTQLALGIQVIPADLLLLLFSYSPLLSACVVGVISKIDADMVTRIELMPVLPLTCLTQLCLAFAGSLNHHQFLRPLSLPKLQDFTLVNCPSSDWTSFSYADFLKSTRSTLTHFRMIEPQDGLMDFGIWDPTDRHFDELLMTHMPQVEMFSIPETFTISPSALEKIARSELLPSATNVEFSVSSLRPALDMLEIRLSRSRKSANNGQTVVSAIENAVVSCSSSSGMEDMIQGLKDQGINIKVLALS